MIQNDNYLNMEGKLSVMPGPSLQGSQISPKQANNECETYYSDCSAALNLHTAAEKGQIPASYASSSFLCFLNKSEGGPNLIQSNDIRGNNFQSSVIGSSSLGASRKKNQVNEISNRALRSANVCTAACSNATYSNREANLGSASNVQNKPIEVGSSGVNSGCPENGGEQCSKTTYGDSKEHESELSRERKGKSLWQSEDSGQHGHATEAAEEEDEKSFEISQFFEAFKNGITHFLNGPSREPESAMDRASEADELTSGLEPSTLNCANLEDQSISDRNGSAEVSRDERIGDSTALEHSNNSQHVIDSGRNGAINFARQNYRDDVYSGFSGKLYDDVEPGDSVSVTFSGPLPFSGPISFSGPVSHSGHAGHVLHSGSVSHRSDSSNASTASFAFPILPFEWNSSPVKMAQPDRRHKRLGWRWFLCNCFCCRNSRSCFS